MGRSRYKIYDDQYPYFITSSIVYGLPIFGVPEVSKIIIESINFLQKNRAVTVYAYVIMENHIHLVVRSELLADKISAFKSFTARQTVNYLKKTKRTIWLEKFREQKLRYKDDRKYQVWQEGYHPKQLVGDKMMLQKINYIHNNPVKSGYVDKPEDWRLSSARNYLGIKGVVPVTLFKGRGG